MKPSQITVLSTVSALVIGALVGRPAIDAGSMLLSGGRSAHAIRVEPKPRLRPTAGASPTTARSSAPAALASVPTSSVARPSAVAPTLVPTTRTRIASRSSYGVGPKRTARPRALVPPLSSVVPVSNGWDLSALTPHEYGAATSGTIAATVFAEDSLSDGAVVELTAPAALPRGMVMLESLRPAWPSWFTPTIDLQARGETASSLAGEASGAFSSRARFGGTVTATPWAKATVVLQDARQFGGGDLRTSNPVDVFEAFGEASTANGRAGVRVGRQRLELGAERLVGDSDWTVLSRSADGLSGWWGKGVLTVRAFAAQVVDVDADGADPWWSNRRLAALSATLNDGRGRGMVAPYLLMSQRDKGADERYTFGTQAEFPLGASVRIDAELAWQRGESLGEPVAASTGHYGVTWRDAAALGRTSIGVEFDHASGDRDPSDGRRQTFDPVAPDRGERFGLVDVVQASNLRHLGVRLAFEPTPRTDVALVYHRLFTDSVTDAVYSPAGKLGLSSVAEQRSRDIGTAFDVRGQWKASRLAVMHVGLATFFGGPLTDQGQGRGRTWRPYAGWRVSF